MEAIYAAPSGRFEGRRTRCAFQRGSGCRFSGSKSEGDSHVKDEARSDTRSLKEKNHAAAGQERGV